jgi:hypothetical protein
VVLCLVFLVLIRRKIMWSQFPPNLSRYSCVVVSVFLLWFPPNLSCLHNNPLENNVEQFPPNLSCLQNNPPENNVEDLAGTCFTLFLSRLFGDQFLLGLRSFLALVLGTNRCTTISTTGPIYAKSSHFYAKMNVSNLNVTNLY